MQKLLLRYWFPITLGLVLTAIAVQAAYAERGGFYVGGEYLITPIACLIHYGLRELIGYILDTRQEEKVERKIIKGAGRAGAYGSRRRAGSVY